MMRMFLILISTIFIEFTLFGQCDSISSLNQKILNLAKQKIGKKIDRGECWDLANYVLTETNAEWDGLYEYGRLLSKDECIMPGDIIQFKNVKVVTKIKNVTQTQSMVHHTAMIYQVYSKTEVSILEQNTAEFGRKIGESKLDFSKIVKGTYKIYRPVEKL